jgi:hypothetical protein
VPTGGTVTYSQVTSGSRLVPKYAYAYSGSSTAGNTFAFSLRTAASASGYSVGEKVCLEIETEFVTAPSNIRNIYAYIDAAGASVQCGLNVVDPATSPTVPGWADQYPEGRCLWRTPIFTVPVGTTSLRVWVQVYMEAGVTTGSCEFVLHSAVLRKYPGALA